MSEVKRYDPEGYSHPASVSGTGTHMIENREGDYVLAADYDGLAQRCRELESQTSTFNTERLRVGKENATLRAENVRLAEWYSEAGVREDTLRAEVERLKRREANGDDSAEIVCAVLSAEIEALRKDAERVNWLAEQFKTCTVFMSGQHPWRPNSYKLRELNGPTFRAAIDTAMEPKP